MKKHFFTLCLLLVGVFMMNDLSAQEKVRGIDPEEMLEKMEAASYEKDMKALIVTDQGTILVYLFASKVPRTVNNFVELAKKGYYDGLTFHRVVPNFMIQGGSPNGTGEGGVGYTFKDEFAPGLKHWGAGILSMANAGPDTNESQFFITHVPTPWLDGKHNVFGQVLYGQEVVNAIQVGGKIEAIYVPGRKDIPKEYQNLLEVE